MNAASLTAGTSALRLPMPMGAAMLGYGARRGGATGVHDPLHARALYLADGRSDLLLVECELCLMAPAQAAAVREELAGRTGVAVERVMVGCVHTHSGPDTGLAARLGGAPPPEHVPALLAALVEAGVRARAGATPARLGVGSAQTTIGRNRRRADAPVDPDVLVVRVDGADGRPLAALFVHGCHPTALGHENRLYSADWPGAAGREIEAAFPGVNPIFVLGAHGDVDPRTRGLLDLAVRDQSRGVSFDAAEALGRELGRSVVGTLGAIETRAEVAVGAAATHLPIPVHPGLTDPAERGQALAALRADALGALGMDEDRGLGSQDLYRLEHDRTEGLAPEERRECIARVRHYLRELTAPYVAGGLVPEVEVQVLHVGPAWLLALPLEATVDVGLDWKQRRGAAAAVLSIANGWLRYLPHPRHYREAEAQLKYEILQSTLVPDAALRLLDAGERLVAGLARAEARGAAA